MLETAAPSKVDVAAYGRSNVLYVEQIAQWRVQCVTAFIPKPMSACLRPRVKLTQRLEGEFLRKEKEFGDAAALMFLR